MNLSRVFPGAVVVVAAVGLIIAVYPPSDPEGKVQLARAGTLPVLEHGRIKPLDSLARTTLLQISNRQYYVDEKDKSQPAIRWFFEVVSSNRQQDRQFPSQQRPGFRLDSDRVRARLGLPAQKDLLYSFHDLSGQMDKIRAEGERVLKVPREEQTDFDKTMFQLNLQLMLYQQLLPYETPHKVFRIENDEVLSLLLLEPRPGSYRYSFSEMLPRLGLVFQEARRVAGLPESPKSTFDRKVTDLHNNVMRYVQLADLNLDTLRVVPPAAVGEKWKTYEEASSGEQIFPIKKLFDSYPKTDPREFNQTLASYQEVLRERMPGVLKATSFEAFYNHAALFYQCTLLYGVVFFLACLSWLGWSEPFRRAAFWLMILTVVVHFLGMLARMYLMQRWLVFVTNLYGTAVFVGIVAAIAGLCLELVYRKGIGLAVGALVGFLTAIVGHNLAGGDTLEKVVAVLDTTFWLAVHVTTINIGYGGVLVAGLLGAGLILLGLFTPFLTRDLNKTLGQMIYGVICFATLFSFFGTVSGGIWADQSWGRFWGWDPKENGALLIVLLCALVLHARWGGMIKQRGLAVLAVLGNIVTLWSWFGVNMLSIGLHSYGFIPEAVFWLLVAVGLHLGVALLGMIPLHHWRSAVALGMAGPGGKQSSRDTDYSRRSRGKTKPLPASPR